MMCDYQKFVVHYVIMISGTHYTTRLGSAYTTLGGIIDKFTIEQQCISSSSHYNTNTLGFE